ncbi:phosphoglycerate mutase family protein [Methanocella sp. MCL-LM]|uniref:phosphoglycerate mutase family protein n=1 Tax=Methanocella sp. MCL-LM TaxID=3412035 RepID=UPI003C770F1E
MLNQGRQVRQRATSEIAGQYRDSLEPDSRAADVLSRNMAFLSPGTSYALLIRHAERPNFTVLNFRNDTPITEKGLQDSFKLGKRLQGQNLTGLFSSPVHRCQQTCEGIRRGASLNHLNITTRPTLGEPGSYIVNPLVVFTYFLTSDVSVVIRKFIAKGRMSGFMPLKEGSVRIMKDLLADLSGENTRNLYITHDAVLAPFISYFTGQKFGDADWINYLDGAFVAVKDGEVRLLWNGREYFIDRELFA